jgi:hypothetical protein
LEFRVHRRPPPPPPPPLRPPLLERLEAPRLLASLARAPLLAPLNALPDEEARLAEGLAWDRDALEDGLGRLALAEGEGREAEAVPVDGRAPALPVEGRALAVALEGPAPPELQPRACWLLADAEGVPLLLSRLWSGCHFCGAPEEDALAPVALAEADLEVLTLAFLLTFTLLLTLTFTSP